MAARRFIFIPLRNDEYLCTAPTGVKGSGANGYAPSAEPQDGRSLTLRSNGAAMLQVYAFSTPNSVRVPIALEEMAWTTS
jgi:hypothetical protein